MLPLPRLAAFGDLAPVRPLPGGHRNAVWLVQGEGGLWVAKSTRRTEAALAWLAPLQDAARMAGFVVPDLRQTKRGHAPEGWTLERHVTGTVPSARDMNALSPMIAAFRGQQPRLPQRPGFCSLPDLLHLSHGGDIALEDLPQEVRTLCRAAWHPFANAPVLPIHGDLTASNILMTAQGPALFDWDEARVDLPFLDEIALRPLSTAETRAHLALEIASGWRLEPERAPSLFPRLRASLPHPH